MNKAAFAFGAVCLSGTVGVVATLVPTSPDAFWLTLLWGTWALTVAWALTRATFSLALATIEAGMLLFVILPATSDVLSGQTIIAGNSYAAGTIPALRMAVLAQGAVLAGAVAARALWPSPPVAQLRPVLSGARLDRAIVGAVLVGILGLLLFNWVGGANLHDFLVFTTESGYGAFARSATGTQVGYFVALQLVAGLALILIALRFTSAAPRGRSLAVVLGLVSIFLVLGGGARGRFFVPALAAGLVWFKTTRRHVGPRRVAVAGLLVLLTISAVVAVARSASQPPEPSDREPGGRPAFASASDLFTPTAGLAQTIPTRVSYLHGSSYLETVVFPIPRSLWTSKPEGEIVQVTQSFDPSNAGLAFPEFGEMYANFGLAGVVVGSFLLGLFVEWLWMRLSRSTSLRESILISVGFAVLAQVFVRGAFAPMVSGSAGLLVATLIVCRRRSPTLVEESRQLTTASVRPIASR